MTLVAWTVEKKGFTTSTREKRFFSSGKTKPADENWRASVCGSAGFDWLLRWSKAKRKERSKEKRQKRNCQNGVSRVAAAMTFWQMQDICFLCFLDKKIQLLKKIVCVDVVVNLHFGKRSDNSESSFFDRDIPNCICMYWAEEVWGWDRGSICAQNFHPCIIRTCYMGEEEGTLKIELRETFAFSSSSSFFGFSIGSSSSCCWNERKRQSFPKFSSPFSQKFHYQKNERRLRRDKFRASPPLEEDANSRRPIPTMYSPKYI